MRSFEIAFETVFQVQKLLFYFRNSFYLNLSFSMLTTNSEIHSLVYEICFSFFKNRRVLAKSSPDYNNRHLQSYQIALY